MTTVPAAAREKEDADFTRFSLEELMDVKVTSASRTPQRLNEVAAAVFVITQDDIRHAGVTSIPDALRMAPGVEVARISATEWAVNIRGLNERFSNKLLVLVDGRSVYTHVFSGVFWDVQDTVLEDIDRIEIIRGPSAAMWGANAVNGVINIITKHSADTQGGRFTALGGDEEGAGTLRHGGRMSEEGTYRVYAKYFNNGDLTDDDHDITTDPSKGDWRSGRAGMRADWRWEDGRELTLQGEAYTNRFDSTEARFSEIPPYERPEDLVSRASGGHVLGRWIRHYSDDADASVQCYLDTYQKDYEGGSVRVTTADLEFQHRFSLTENHEILWGLTGRAIRDEFDDTLMMTLEPDREDLFRFGGFIQDRISLVPDRLAVTVGAKLEYNSYTHAEVQPNLRLLWSVDERHSLWAAVSRAVRVPSRTEHDGIKNNGMKGSEQWPILVYSHGDGDLDPEQLIAYEIGYRFQPRPDFWINLSGFYNDYENLIVLTQRSEPTPSPSGNYDILPLFYANDATGESSGVEMSVSWRPCPFLRLDGAYTFLETRIREREEIVSDIADEISDASNPRNQVSLRSRLSLGRDVDLDLWCRYVDRLSENDVNEYLTLDARLAWRPTPATELALVGRNLLEEEHAEFSSLQIERTFYLKLAWSF